MATAKQRKRKQQRRTQHNDVRSNSLVNKGEFKHTDHHPHDTTTKHYSPRADQSSAPSPAEAAVLEQLLGHVPNTEGDTNGQPS